MRNDKQILNNMKFILISLSMYFKNISENVRKGLNLSLKNCLIGKLNKKKKLFRKAYIENLDFFDGGTLT